MSLLERSTAACRWPCTHGFKKRSALLPGQHTVPAMYACVFSRCLAAVCSMPCLASLICEAQDLKSPFCETRIVSSYLQVARLGIKVPPLCACHEVSPLDPAYPEHCASNCPLHHNEVLYYDMLGTTLQALGLSV
jgi:hypothetical protein